MDGEVEATVAVHFTASAGFCLRGTANWRPIAPVRQLRLGRLKGLAARMLLCWMRRCACSGGRV